MPRPLAADYAEMTDVVLAAHAARREPKAVRLITQRNNQRLYRAAWSILRNRAEAEEAVQDGYLKAFRALDRFRGEASLSTWLTRIVINEALGRRRSEGRRRREAEQDGVVFMDRYREMLTRGSAGAAGGEDAVMRRQLAALLEQALARLPQAFRLTFVLREVEGLSVEETAEATRTAPSTVRSRLFRARERLRLDLENVLGGTLRETLRFDGADCAAMTSRVLAALEDG